MKILLASTNHNTYDRMLLYLESIKTSYNSVKNKIELSVIISDNSDSFTPLNLEMPFSLKIVRSNNLGYLNSINYALQKTQIKLSTFDFLIISNVDLQISKCFFEKLLLLKLSSYVGWIAPNIHSAFENQDRNPKMVKRPSKKRLLTLYWFYKIPILMLFYYKFFYKRRRSFKTKFKEYEIYAGHGSFMIFTPPFIKTLENLEYFAFLFNEEIYFAEKIRLAGLKTVYCQELEILDYDHASTSKLPSLYKMKLNASSLKRIIKNYF